MLGKGMRQAARYWYTRGGRPPRRGARTGQKKVDGSNSGRGIGPLAAGAAHQNAGACNKLDDKMCRGAGIMCGGWCSDDMHAVCGGGQQPGQKAATATL